MDEEELKDQAEWKLIAKAVRYTLANAIPLIPVRAGLSRALAGHFFHNCFKKSRHSK